MWVELAKLVRFQSGHALCINEKECRIDCCVRSKRQKCTTLLDSKLPGAVYETSQIIFQFIEHSVVVFHLVKHLSRQYLGARRIRKIGRERVIVQVAEFSGGQYFGCTKKRTGFAR